MTEDAQDTKYVIVAHPGLYPVGTIIPEIFSPESPRAQGGLLSKSEYPELYQVIGKFFGPGDEDHFRIPDMRSRPWPLLYQ